MSKEVKKISTTDAKKIALKDITKEVGKGNVYSRLLMLSLKNQLKSLPTNCRVSLNDININNLKKITPPQNYNYFYNNYIKNPEKVWVDIIYEDKNLKRNYNSYVQHLKYKVTRSCYFFINSFGLKCSKIEDNKFYINAVELVRHKRNISGGFLDTYDIKIINEYNELLIKVAKNCEIYFKDFDVNDYSK